MVRQALYDDAGKRTKQDTIEEKDRCWGAVGLRGAGQKQVKIFWDLNEEAIRDHICKIEIGGETAYVDADQLMKFLRWV